MTWSVIVVEDEDYVRDAIIKLIPWEEEGFQLVGVASDGIPALELIRRERPDLVITDIVMPRMDGIHLLKQAREEGSAAKFIMLTCMNEFEYAQQALEYGASSYILKLSMDIDKLRASLKKVSEDLMNDSLKKRLVSQLEQHELHKPYSTNHPQVNEVLHYMQLHYAEDITLKSMAKRAAMEEHYFSALFKKKTGENFNRLLQKIRLEHAKVLLKETDFGMNKVAAKVGLGSDHYFIRLFKREYGQTPGDFRKRQGG
ncbi:response regulator [Paenibacillus sp. J5C_2022]|uniref:response regulator n=1 Tax=Paenibacillus sp. J5C2022 TaxID=2977129 RepID=UPI0021D0F4EF|nr:response regulator [Paenibacillus sp. J5C2022]MCU6708886.1 response regulator [Paenibacillus sp. J5C2022]